MADGYDFFNMDGGGRSIRNEDFEEEDVWAVVKDRKDTSPRVRKPKDHQSSVSSPTPRRFPTASRMIPRAANNATHEARAHQQSAPVNIPDWSKTYKKNSKGSGGHSFSKDGSRADGGSYSYSNAFINDDGESNVIASDDGDDDEMIPPHEWIAKKMARSQISSFSVFEGIGRTLKGRDLSKVRNAILTRTGFLE
ncbi:PREDICTED: uncharacterized protein LOC104612795 [Nelumbo nucifera]|uniref:Uncharacterized protein LOC104612795 n=2 Tax=Nelumbo nucifera TaxID=4432 RepID=A0A1U8BBK1_NELNU|nr:PREDICTED: uncharacterized protein LOC104612795 [Nelumbo nucifera]DAD23371.1 TPA_asm: hypothetical protein HUJ06_024834 [Nelumbo nucifera]